MYRMKENARGEIYMRVMWSYQLWADIPPLQVQTNEFNTVVVLLFGGTSTRWRTGLMGTS